MQPAPPPSCLRRHFCHRANQGIRKKLKLSYRKQASFTLSSSRECPRPERAGLEPERAPGGHGPHRRGPGRLRKRTAFAASRRSPGNGPQGDRARPPPRTRRPEPCPPPAASRSPRVRSGISSPGQYTFGAEDTGSQAGVRGPSLAPRGLPQPGLRLA